MIEEYNDKYSNRFYGKRRARVSNNQDPQLRGRIKVECPDLYGNGESDWALPSFPFFGGRDSGFLSIPPVGSMVWIECEEGFIDYPIYTGGFFDLIQDGHNTDGSPAEDDIDYQEDPSAAPGHAKGFYDGTDSGGLKGRYGVPSTSYAGEYGKVTILQTPRGHMLELDDTEGSERIQLHHRNGSHIEILPDGTIHIIAEGNIIRNCDNSREVIHSVKESDIGLDQNTTVQGNNNTVVQGSSTNTVGLTSTFSSESSDVTITNVCNVDTGSLLTSVASLLDLNIGGETSLNCFSDFNLISTGAGYLSFSNALTTPTGIYVSPSLSLSSSNGTAKLVSGDPTQEISVYGIEARGGIGGQVYLGALNTLLRTPTLGVGPLPLVKENAVCGIQLLLLLQTMMTTLNTFLGACTTPPAIIPAASIALTALATAQSTFLTVPSPIQPLILSEVVYVSKV
jgi:hypothetical protein